MAAETDGRPRIRNVGIARRIESHAVRLVLERGYDDVTVDAICSAAGVAQRTFFNYLGTKQAAVLGRDLPTVDEAAVRRFLAGDGDLLPGALTLVRPARTDEEDLALAAQRVEAIRRTPALLRAQMERFEGVREEVVEILGLRLARDARPGETAEDLALQGLLLAEIVAALLRVAAERLADGASLPEQIPVLTAGLGKLLPKLTGP